jgi:hypothetical protein
LLADVGSQNRAEQVAVFVGIGFDRDAVLADRVRQLFPGFDLRLALFFLLLAVLFDGRFVLFGCNCRQSLRDQVVAGEASSDFDDFALLSDVRNVFSKQQFGHAATARSCLDSIGSWHGSSVLNLIS